MKAFPICLYVLAFALPATSSLAQSADPGKMLDNASSLLGQQAAAPSTGPSLTLPEVERIALAENPEIHLAARKVAMAESHVPTVGTLDDPQFMLRSWGVPLKKPWDYNAAQNMLMVGQSFPGVGKRSLRTSVAQSDVEIAKEDLASTRLRIQVEVRKAFFDLLRAQEELRIHDQHVGIAHQAIEAARIKYTVGKVPQFEILKAQLALTRLAEHMIRFERDAEVARAHLNTLLARKPDMPLQVQGDLGLSHSIPSLDALEQLALESRPDLRQLAAAAEKSRREQALAKKAYSPDFSVSAGYMLMPSGSDMRNNYMIEGSVNLPWLNRRKHDADIAEAATALTERDAELTAMRNTARGQIQEALIEAQAAQRLARVYQDSLRAQSEQALHAAVIAYENDQTSFLGLLDSQMAVVDIDLAWVDALGEFSNRMADLQLAVGTQIGPDQPLAKEEAK